MKLSSRYKLIGKRKFAMLNMPIERVEQIFEDAVKKSNSGSKILGSVDRKTGVFKMYLKIKENKNIVYENYCLLVELKEGDDNTTKIEYCFVYDRAICIYTRMLSFICFAAPVVASTIAYYIYEAKNLFVYLPLAAVALFGVVSLFAYGEKKQKVRPIVTEFENMLVTAFEE